MMSNMLFKKGFSAFCAVVITALNCLVQFSPVGAFESFEDNGAGGLWSEMEITEEQPRSITAPSSFDITTNSSTSSFFPSIGNQGNINSCAGWATTYYQYTYEVNKLKNEATSLSNTFSPSWTYNYINCGQNIYTKLSNAYFVLKNQGAMLLSDYPHSSSLSSYSFAWSTNLVKMREALQYRATVTTNSVTYSSLSSLNTIKSKISNGKPAVIWTDPGGWTIRTGSNGEYVIVRGSYSTGGHFMTVVGYDDNYQTIVNGVTLTGALKLANSKGATWKNNGYIWVAYDALLLTSAQGTAWQSGMSGQRVPVFGGASYDTNTSTYTYNNNNFSFMNVYHCDNYFTETVQFTSYDPWYLNIYGKNGSSSTTSDTYKKKKSISSQYPLSSADTRYLVFDYTNPGTSIDPANYLSTSWTMNMATASSHSTYNIISRLTDNLGNEIEIYTGPAGSISSGTYQKTHYSNIAKGRLVAYDNNPITSDDVDRVMMYLAGSITFSSLQYYLADYDNNGVVGISDAILMMQHISSNCGLSYSLKDIIPGTDYSIADYIENEMNIDYEDFIRIHHSELDSMGVLY